MSYITLHKISKFMKDPAARFKFLNSLGLYSRMPDERFLKKMYKACIGKELNLDDPQTFNEKLQWLKIYDRRPEYTRMVDKYSSKDFAAERIGKEHIIPTYGVWEKFEDIDFNKLPDQFVLKTTHDSGSVVICKDKTLFNVKDAKMKLQESLEHNYFRFGREWPYKDVQPRIIAEKYMVDESGYELRDYKFLCFNGEPKVMYIGSDRQVDNEETKFDFYDMDFNLLPFTNGHPNSSKLIKCPKSFEEMKKLATKLSEGIPHLRVDFYNINGRIYFGELTFFHNSGFVAFEPDEWNYKLGSYLTLPEKSK